MIRVAYPATPKNIFLKNIFLDSGFIFGKFGVVLEYGNINIQIRYGR